MNFGGIVSALFVVSAAVPWAKEQHQTPDRTQTYQNKQLGFEIQYPIAWAVFRDGEGFGEGNPYYIGLGNPELSSESSDGDVGISVHSKSKSLEKIADQVGIQFGSSRKIERKRIKAGGLPALLQRVTVPGLKDWDCRSIFLEGAQWIFAIGNGCMTRSIPDWKRIYPTFRLVNEKS